MVKCEKFPVAPASLAKEKLKGENGSYREPDVIEQLVTDFHDKCYICELKDLSDINVEHLVPHKGNLDLRFDWKNLFLSCPHCNGVKNQRQYDGKIINCCEEDPEKHISCEYLNQEVHIKALDADEKSVMTAHLIDNVFNLRNTGMREKASDYRFRELQKEMNIFFNVLYQYEKQKTAVSKRRVCVRLKRSSAFAAFKRGYIRGNAKYAELQEYVAV